MFLKANNGIYYQFVTHQGEPRPWEVAANLLPSTIPTSAVILDTPAWRLAQPLRGQDHRMNGGDLAGYISAAFLIGGALGNWVERLWRKRERLTTSCKASCGSWKASPLTSSLPPLSV